jgi:23S rRNA pseudouridine1911/1915/1917 synthase
MEQTIELLVAESGQRLDKYIAQEEPDLSRSLVQRLIREGLVIVNGQVVKASRKVEVGDTIVLRVPLPEPPELRPEAIPLDIVYEDVDLLVVNKPAGMVVHPAYGHRTGTLVNAVLAHCPGMTGVGDTLRSGIVHRLDKDTSGLIIVAKNDAARQHLQQQFKRREVKKVYLALVEGHLEPAQGLIEAPIGRDPRRRKRMAVVRAGEGGREARTKYQVMGYFALQVGGVSHLYTLVEVRPVTGRTHQVRVHFAFIGHPLVGDPVYGFRKRRLADYGLPPLDRQFLHAQSLGFHLPHSNEYVEFRAELPTDLREVLERLRALTDPRPWPAEEFQDLV